MFATNSTTTAAFLATGFSTLMPISSFGFCSAFIVVANYASIIIFFPTILVVWETKIKKNSS